MSAHSGSVVRQGRLVTLRQFKFFGGFVLFAFSLLMLLGALGLLSHGMLSGILVVVLLLMYPFWVLEHRLSYNKMGPTMVAAVMAWLLIGTAAGSGEDELIWNEFEHSFLEVFLIFFYVLTALKLVKRLANNEGFTGLRYWLMTKGGTAKGTFIWMGCLTFPMSAVFDNLTVTVIMLQIAMLIYSGRNLVMSAAMVVAMANAGGAWSPIGDVTTIMLWLEGKVSAGELISLGLLPSLAYGMMFMLLVSRGVDESDWVPLANERMTLTREQRIINPIIMASFLLPPILSVTLGAHPIIGLLAAFGVVYLITETLNEQIKEREVGETIDNPREAQLVQAIEHESQVGEVYVPSHSSMSFHVGVLLDEEEWYGLWFIAGALLLVAAWSAHGLIQDIANLVFTGTPSDERIIAGFIFLHPISALIDNIPLTAAAMDMVQTDSPMLWVLLALSVGTGGTLTAFGSAAGVIAMGMVRDFNPIEGAKISFIPAICASAAMFAVWYLQWAML